MSGIAKQSHSFVWNCNTSHSPMTGVALFLEKINKPFFLISYNPFQVSEKWKYRSLGTHNGTLRFGGGGGFKEFWYTDHFGYSTEVEG